MSIGLVTVTYNSADVLPDFLQSVCQQNFKDFQLFVIDNHSTDLTIEVLKKRKQSNFELIINQENVGVAAANNQGIKKALSSGCEYILLINNDTTFEANLLEKLIDASQKYNSSIVAPKIMYYSAKNRIWFAGGFFDRKKAWINYHRGQNELDQGQYLENDVIEYAPTCCTLIHRSVFEDIGLMDEKYFVYFDDTDFFYRVLKHGKHQTRYINDIKFYHKIGSLTKSRVKGKRLKFGDFFVKQMTCNQIYYLKKQKSFYAYLYILFFIIRLQLRFLFSGKYMVNLKTFALIQRAILKGLRL